MEIVIGVIAGILLGALAVWGWARARLAWLQAQTSQQAAQVNRLEAEKNQLQSEKQQLAEQLRVQESEAAGLRTRLEEREAQHQDLVNQKRALEQQMEGIHRQIQELHQQYIAAQERYQATHDQLKAIEERSDKLNEELRSLRDKLIEEQKSRAAAEAEGRSSRELLEKRDQMLNQLKTEFEKLAGELLQRTQDRFQQVGAQSIRSLLEPFQKDLEALSNRIGQHQSATDQLRGKVEQLALQSTQISEQAQKLAEALRGNVQLQGQLGEIVLERVLQWSQMQEGKHYEKQVGVTVKGPEGNRILRPDFVLKLPNGGKLVVDSKVSLRSYYNYFQAQGKPEEQKEHAKALVEAIRNHIRQLSGRAYHQAREISTFDFVVMFVGIEGAFQLAVDQEPSLLEEAINQNVLLASPSTLVSITHIVHILHDMYKQSTNAQKIVELGTKLYEKLCGFVEALEGVGKGLDKAQKEYRAAWNRLVDGKVNVLELAEEMREQGGLRTTKQLPGPAYASEDGEAPLALGNGE